ncbi:pilus assembly PilX family protein [Eionea flava]
MDCYRYVINARSGSPCARQQGVVLIVSLVMLLVMTVAGVTTMTGATLQERIAGNQRQQIVARVNAERVLRQAEVFLNGLSVAGSFGDNQLSANFAAVDDGLYFTEPVVGGGITQPLGFTRQDSAQWTALNSALANNDNNNPIGRYTIEYMGISTFSRDSVGSPEGFGGSNNYDDSNRQQDGADGRKVFRITAMGLSNTAPFGLPVAGNVAVIIETSFFEVEQ